jgi:4'-phosphopantetheinyl transferase
VKPNEADSTSDLRWRAAPHEPRLAPRAVHVWQADLARVSDEVLRNLCSDEHARAERFLARDRGRRWARSRGVLRSILGRYLDEDPAELRFVTCAHGKPAVLNDSAAVGPPTRHRSSQLLFNLSHSGEMALYAVSAGVPVGVDVELARTPIDWLALAPRVFGAQEARRLEALEPTRREQECLRMWVRREAILKCLGTGIGRHIVPKQKDRGPWTARLDIGPQGSASIAAAETPSELSCWSWPGGETRGTFYGA